MSERNLPAGLIAIVSALLGGGYLVRALFRALANGFSPGKLGAIHQAGTVQYAGFLVICVVGIGLMLVLAWMGLHWAGFFDRRR